MSWDIYGNPLRRGYCEVHPDVHQEYPCSICMASKQQYEQPHDKLEQLKHDFAQQGDYIRHLESQRNELVAKVDDLIVHGTALATAASMATGALSIGSPVTEFCVVAVKNFNAVKDATPAACLAQVRAEALMSYLATLQPIHPAQAWLEIHLTNYASRIRQGGAE